MHNAADDRPITLRERRLACENAKFDIFFDWIEDVGGHSVRNYLVVSPKTKMPDLVTGVAMLPVMNGRIGLLKVYRHATGEYSWEIPRGFVERAEDDLNSVAREFEEETGLGCREQDIVSLGYMTPDAGVLSARVHLFAARASFAQQEYVPAELGHRALQFFSLSEVDRMMRASEIQDSYTVAAICKYFVWFAVKDGKNDA